MQTRGRQSAVNLTLTPEISTITGGKFLPVTCGGWQLISAAAEQWVRLPSTSGMPDGWSVTIRATGAAALDIQNSSGVSQRKIAPGDGASFVWTGTAWHVIPLESGESAINAVATGTACAVNFAYGCTTFMPSGNYTISTSNAPSSGRYGVTLLALTNGGAYTPTWPAMSWRGGSAPALSASGTDLIQLMSIGGSLWGIA